MSILPLNVGGFKLVHVALISLPPKWKMVSPTNFLCLEHASRASRNIYIKGTAIVLAASDIDQKRKGLQNPECANNSASVDLSKPLF